MGRKNRRTNKYTSTYFSDQADYYSDKFAGKYMKISSKNYGPTPKDIHNIANDIFGHPYGRKANGEKYG
jgi:hypothetical protein